MANYNAKGRKAMYGEVAQVVSFRLYSWEKEKVIEFIKKLHNERKNNII